SKGTNGLNANSFLVRSFRFAIAADAVLKKLGKSEPWRTSLWIQLNSLTQNYLGLIKSFGPKILMKQAAKCNPSRCIVWLNFYSPAQCCLGLFSTITNVQDPCKMKPCVPGFRIDLQRGPIYTFRLLILLLLVEQGAQLNPYFNSLWVKFDCLAVSGLRFV